MVKDMTMRLRLALKDSEAAGPKHGVILSKVDAKRLLYRLIKEDQAYTNVNCTCTNCRNRRECLGG